MSDDIKVARTAVSARDEISGRVIGAAIEVHRSLGPGLLESVYEECLCQELSLRHIPFERQRQLPVRYKEVLLATSYRVDLIVERTLIVEIKAIDRLLPVHEAQLLTYLRLSALRVGILLNFNVPRLTNGILRRVL